MLEERRKESRKAGTGSLERGDKDRFRVEWDTSDSSQSESGTALDWLVCKTRDPVISDARGEKPGAVTAPSNQSECRIGTKPFDSLAEDESV